MTQTKMMFVFRNSQHLCLRYQCSLGAPP